LFNYVYFTLHCLHRWFYSRIVEDLHSIATSPVQHEILVNVLTGGSSSDELIPNAELSRHGYLHESVHVWLKGILELTAQQTVLSTFKEEKCVFLKLVLNKENLSQIVDHIIATTDTSSKIRH
jgi:hypothetical protein